MPYKTIADLPARLEEIIYTFSEVAMQCVDIFFARSCTVMEPWYLTDNIDCGTDRIVTLGHSNKTYQAVTIIGIDHGDCQKLFGRSIRDDEYHDIFGEFVNNYCALLVDMDDFTRYFGVLLQSVPAMYPEGMSFLPAVPGVRGRIVFEGGAVIKIGFSIKQRAIAEK